MPRKYTEARKDSNIKWDKENLDRISIALPKGSRDRIKAHAEHQGESVNSFIKRAVSETIDRDAVSDRAISADLAAFCAECGCTEAEFTLEAIREKLEREHMTGTATEFMIALYHAVEAIEDAETQDSILKAMWFFIQEYGVPDAGIVFERNRDGSYQAHLSE